MLRKAFLTIAVGAVALTLGASSSKAVEIDFGSLTAAATAGGCTHAGTDPGSVCGATLAFTGTAAGNLTATAFNGSPNAAAGTAFITFKAIGAFQGAPANGLSESGLGENTHAAPGCSDTTCEINGSHSVAVQSSVALSLADVLIGSAQSGEAFTLWTGSSPGSLVNQGTFTPGTNITCPGDVCTLNFAAAMTVAIQNAGTGDVLLTSVSTPGVPEPASLALLGAALAGFGVMRRRRR